MIRRKARALNQLLAGIASLFVPIETAGANMVAIYDPSEPTAILEVIRFELQRPCEDRWNPGGEQITNGLIIVLRDNELSNRKDAEGDRMLFVGNRVSEVLARGGQSGIVIAVASMPESDEALARRSPIWFGSSAVPESMSREDIYREIDAASAKRVRSIAEHLQDQTIEAQSFEDKAELLSSLPRLLKQCCPDDAALLDRFTAPRGPEYPKY